MHKIDLSFIFICNYICVFKKSSSIYHDRFSHQSKYLLSASFCFLLTWFMTRGNTNVSVLKIKTVFRLDLTVFTVWEGLVLWFIGFLENKGLSLNIFIQIPCLTNSQTKLAILACYWHCKAMKYTAWRHVMLFCINIL